MFQKEEAGDCVKIVHFHAISGLQQIFGCGKQAELHLEAFLIDCSCCHEQLKWESKLQFQKNQETHHSLCLFHKTPWPHAFLANLCLAQKIKSNVLQPM